MAKEKPQAELVKTTLRIEPELWLAVRHRALDEGIQVMELVTRALRMYLKGGKR